MAQIGMGQEPEARFQFRLRRAEAAQTRAGIAAPAGQGADADSGLDRLGEAEHRVEAQGDALGWGMLLHEAQEMPAADPFARYDPVAPRDLRSVLGETVERPGQSRESAADQNRRGPVAGAQGNVCIAPRQVERAFRDEQVDPDGRYRSRKRLNNGIIRPVTKLAGQVTRNSPETA